MSITSLYRRNVGGLDRGIRLVLGAALVAAGLSLAGGIRGESFGILVALAGLVGLLSGITGRCPLYTPFGISTARSGATSGRASVCLEKESHHQVTERAG
jgi:uncharacterized membrane protein